MAAKFDATSADEIGTELQIFLTVVSDRRIPRPSGTRTTPRFAMTEVPRRGSTLPRKRTVPVELVRPMTERGSVDLPAPFGPTATSSPSNMSKSMEWRASTCP